MCEGDRIQYLLESARFKVPSCRAVHILCMYLHHCSVLEGSSCTRKGKCYLINKNGTELHARSKIEIDTNLLTSVRTTVQKLTTSTSVKLNALRGSHETLRRVALKVKDNVTEVGRRGLCLLTSHSLGGSGLHCSALCQLCGLYATVSSGL